MSANNYQVGGGHYKAEYQHWDLVLKTGMGYLEGQATKYVARWRRKGGVEDLRKALHFVDKLIEDIAWVLPDRGRIDLGWKSQELGKFFAANELQSREKDIVRWLCL